MTGRLAHIREAEAARGHKACKSWLHSDGVCKDELVLADDIDLMKIISQV